MERTKTNRSLRRTRNGNMTLQAERSAFSCQAPLSLDLMLTDGICASRKLYSEDSLALGDYVAGGEGHK